ncbi:PPE family protein, partial [Mycobacterium kansasii]
NNGFFWRGDGQGHAGFDYTLTIPAIALNLGVNVPLNIPITGHLGDIVIGSFTIPTLHLNGSNLTGTIGPIVVDPITITGPSLDLHVGGPGESLQLDISGPALGPVVIPVLQVAAGPGVGNSTGVPSSGFFNSGVGGAS